MKMKRINNCILSAVISAMALVSISCNSEYQEAERLINELNNCRTEFYKADSRGASLTELRAIQTRADILLEKLNGMDLTEEQRDRVHDIYYVTL